MKRASFFLASSLSLLGACGKDSSSDKTASPVAPAASSCAHTTEPKACSDYVGASYNAASTQTSNKKNCESYGGVFSNAACATDLRVGSCQFNGGKVDEIYERYYSNNASSSDATKAKALCDATKIGGVAGVFIPD